MQFKIGDTTSIEKKFSQDEVLAYAKINVDSNPIHYDTAYSEKTVFKKPIVPGLLTTSLFGGLLGCKLPGNGTIHLGQNVVFLKPVYIDEVVKATITISEIRSDKPIITFQCVVHKSNGEVAITGEAKVIYKGKYF